MKLLVVLVLINLNAVSALARRPPMHAVSRRLAVLAGVVVAAPKVEAAEVSLGYVDNAGGVHTCVAPCHRACECSSHAYGTPFAAKSYSQVQRAWEKSAGMSQREIMMAARGAAKVDASDLSQESDRSRKRRAMAGCKDEMYRKQAGYDAEASCNSKVLAGDVQFMLDVIDAPLQ